MPVMRSTLPKCVVPARLILLCLHIRVCHRSQPDETLICPADSVRHRRGRPGRPPRRTRKAAGSPATAKVEPGKCRLSPGSRRAGPSWTGPQCSSCSLPAPQNRVGQDARPEKQRRRRQQDGRTTALRNTSSLTAGHRSLHHHHGGVTVSHCHRHQDQHGQESGHGQKNCPLHPVLLLSTLSLKWPALVFSNGEDTHSVQNRNAKVSIILTIFNRISSGAVLTGHRGRKRGQKDSNLRAF